MRPTYQKAYSNTKLANHLQSSLYKEIKIYIIYFLFTAIITTSIYAFARNYFFSPIVIAGQSMQPYHNSNDKILINKLFGYIGDFKRGDIVVLHPPKNCTSESLYIKRIIGLPGEQVIFDNGQVYIKNSQYALNPILLDESYLQPNVKSYKAEKVENEHVEEIVLTNDQYYFMGDNRPNSQDSRICGPINKSQIIGKEFYKLEPTNQAGFTSNVNYKNIGF